jgi:hypothetical protein
MFLLSPISIISSLMYVSSCKMDRNFIHHRQVLHGVKKGAVSKDIDFESLKKKA